MGASVIAFDVLFLEPSRFGPEDDARLAEAAARAGNVIFGHKLTHIVDQQFRTSALDKPVPPLAEAAWSLGLVNHPPDPDRFARRSYLYLMHQGRFEPTPALAAAAAHLGLSMDVLAFDAEAVAVRGSGALTVGGREIGLLPAGPFAGTYVINFLGGARTVRTIPYYQVLDRTAPREWIEGRIVLVGAVTPDLEDLFATPFFHMGLMPGVEVHANAVVTLLEGNPLAVPPPYATLLIIIAAATGAAWLGGRGSAGAGSVAALLGAGALAAAAWWAFAARGVWLPMVPPLAGVAASYTLVNAYRFAAEERERRRVHGMFGRCVSKEVVDQILNYEGDIPLGGARQEATLLFTDIRGFTGMSETMAPEDVVALLNEYFEAMTTIILDHGGTIDKFMGDAIMAVFGAPIPRDDHAERCVQAAVEMRKALRSLQARWEAEGKPR